MVVMCKVERWFHITLVVILIQEIVNGEMEGFIVNGNRASIKKYPYAAYLAVMCDALWTCGSSILNQDLVITAAHCFENCPTGSGTAVGIMAGQEEIQDKFTRFAAEVKPHENYDQESILNDIALIRMDRPLIFSHVIKKIAITKRPDYRMVADIVGWGLTNEQKGIPSNFLKSASQKIWCREECLKFLEVMPIRSFCAGSKNENKGYAAVGDSGSGLVVKGYILIGLLSYKMPTISASVAIYTNVASYYSWIRRNSASLYCQEG